MTEHKPIPLTLKLDHRGRVLIPLDLRKEWNLEPGDFVIIDLKDKL